MLGWGMAVQRRTVCWGEGDRVMKLMSGLWSMKDTKTRRDKGYQSSIRHKRMGCVWCGGRGFKAVGRP